jgi:hypothetical protein
MLLIERALAGTAALWPAVEQGFVFAQAAARLLANSAGERGTKVRRRFDGLLAAMQRHRHRIGEPGAPLDHLARLIRHTGVTCVDFSSAGGRLAAHATASAAIPTPTSTPSNDRLNVNFAVVEKTGHAAEQEREDVKAARLSWFGDQLDLDPDRIVFLAETAPTTKATRQYGRTPRGAHFRIAAPAGHVWTPPRVQAASLYRRCA